MLAYLSVRIKILLLILIFFFNSQAQEKSGTGGLTIILESPGYIYINSELISNASIKNLQLKKGEYTVSVHSMLSNNWNNRGYEKTITIKPNQIVELKISDSKLYYLNSNPFGSKIIQNNKILGTTPSYLHPSQFNMSEEISIRKNGFNPETIIVDNSKTNYFVKLKPISNQTDILVASSKLDNSQASWYKEGFLVVSILSSWAAFYFKREADKNYNKYLTEGNSSKMNNYYDRTKRYDTYSDISLSISLGSVGTFMYFLLFD